MDKEILDKKLGSVGSFELDLVDGNLEFKLNADVTGVSASILLKIDSGELLDKLAAVIPGQFDDAVIGMLKAALKA